MRDRDVEKIPSGEDLKKLFREWDEDYAARREENRREREGVPSYGPPETWPSEIAKANRQKQPGQQPGTSNGKDKSNGHDYGHSM